jgi:beta-phosphoglucomutase family hydrolase
MSDWAAIFDWDGVIIDSSRHHEEAWEILAAETGRSLPPGFFLRSFGMKNEKVIAELLGWRVGAAEVSRLSLRKEALYRQQLEADGASALPGVLAWLDQLRAASVPCALGSSTHLANIRCVSARIGVEDRFVAIVSGEDVTRGKPDPEVFLLAARRLGRPPGRCVVFEDAHVGIEAARAAGMKVVAVASTHPAASLRDADRVVRRLDELTVEEISQWFV